MDKKDRLSRIECHIMHLAENLDKSGFYDYIAYVNDRKKMYKNSFLMGMFRGIGTAIGLSLCAAVIILILRSIANSSIPYIADFIGKIIAILESGT